jgi:hypothetical protein
MKEFGYEKLEAYRCSMEFLASVFALVDKRPKGFAHPGDQLNIAEGLGKYSPAERRHFYEIACVSALE